jgi:hypothetical protein
VFTARYGLNFYVYFKLLVNWLVAGLLPRKLGFDLRPLCARFLAEKVSLISCLQREMLEERKQTHT